MSLSQLNYCSISGYGHLKHYTGHLYYNGPPEGKGVLNPLYGNKVHSQDINTKKYFSIYNKYYVGDLGIRNSLSGFNYQRDIGILLENYVFLILKKYGYNINIGRNKNGKEVDFIIEKYGKIRYIQVTQSLTNEQTIKREYDSLSTIKDNRPKFIVSMDENNLGESDGVIHSNILSFEDIIQKFSQNLQ